MAPQRSMLALALAVVAALFAARPHAQPPTAPQNNLVYEVFVRSFADGDNDPKGIGDLKGLTSQLDRYLNDGNPQTTADLEAGILWLMPIFPSPSYHGYDVTNYRDINPDYGTLSDFTTLLTEAHRRGVRIVLDAVFNHTSDEHPWFREAINDASSPRRRFYTIEADTGDRPGPWHRITNASGEKLRYLGLFSPRMPDLDFDNPDVRREIEDIAKFWIDLGVDGFRLDAAKHIYGASLDRLTEDDILHNNEWWLEFSRFVYRLKPDAILIGEVLGDPEIVRRHAWGLDGLVDEPFMNDVRAGLAHPSSGLAARYAQFVEQARALNRSAFDPSLPFPDQPFEAYPYLASHDRNPRLASDLEDMAHHGMPYSVEDAYRLGMEMLLSMTERPILYQGDELMQTGWKWNGNPPNDPREPGDGSGIYDETLREPFPWFASSQGPGQTRWFAPKFDRPNDGVSREEQEKSGSVLDLVRGLSHFRARHPAFADGSIGAIASDSADWVVFERASANERYMVLINRTESGQDYRFHASWFPQYRGADLMFWSNGHDRTWRDVSSNVQQIGDSVFVPPVGVVILRQRQ